jgi:DNA-binding MarR family transcriptional regulator
MSSPSTITPIHIGVLLTEVKDALIADFQRRMHEAGYTDIRESHGCVFRHLPPDGLRLSDIAELARITKQSVGEHVAVLESLGYVERVPDDRDGRVKIIRPTKKGLASQKAARKAFLDIEAKWAEEIGEERIAALRGALEAIRALHVPS